MIAEQEPITSPGPELANDPDVHLQHLFVEQDAEPFLKSLIKNVREAINPPKLPPLVVTSTPVPVKDIWGFYGGQGKRAGLSSILIHFSVVLLLFLIGTNKHVQQMVKEHIDLIAPDLAPYKATPKNKPMGGGGGGGDRSPVPASKGKLPKFEKTFVPPMVKPPENPKLVLPESIVAQDLLKVDLGQVGDPLSRSGVLSNGMGSGGGIGSGQGGGIGPGNGNGHGPGSGGNVGGGPYRIGGGVSAPTVLYKVEPEYSEEARKAKFQGTVVLYIVVDVLLHKGPLPVNTIGLIVDLTPGSISIAVDRLFAKGLVSRVESGEDRRVRIVATVASKFVWIYNRLGISFMQVSKWGNSLAVRLPAVVVEALDLKEGDEIEISIAGKRDFKVARDRSKERALEQLRQMKWSFPPDFKFNREEINER